MWIKLCVITNKILIAENPLELCFFFSFSLSNEVFKRGRVSHSCKRVMYVNVTYHWMRLLLPSKMESGYSNVSSQRFFSMMLYYDDHQCTLWIAYHKGNNYGQICVFLIPPSFVRKQKLYLFHVMLIFLRKNKPRTEYICVYNGMCVCVGFLGGVSGREEEDAFRIPAIGDEWCLSKTRWKSWECFLFFIFCCCYTFLPLVFFLLASTSFFLLVQKEIKRS